MDLARTEPPASELFTLADAKVHVRADSDADDTLITGIIESVDRWLDGYDGILGRALLTQSWEVRYDYAFPAWRILLPLCPLQSVDYVRYVDSSGQTVEIDPSQYAVLDGPVAAVEPAYGLAWPAPRSQTRAVRIGFTVGYGDAATDVPGPIITAAKLMMAHLYANREAVVGVNFRDSSAPLPMGVADLLAPYRARRAA